MRFALLFSASLAATAALAAIPTSLNWIADAGGALTRNAQGQVIAIDLRASWVGDSDLASLAALPGLNRLDLSQTRISDHGLRQLKSAPAITDLDLRYAELITDEGISVLKTWKRLKRLDLEGTKITDSALQHLSALSSLESLNISSVLVTDAGTEALTSLTNLKELTLGGNKLTDAGLQPLRQLPGLTFLDLGGAQRTDSGIWLVSFTQPGLEAVATLKDLRQLRLEGTLITASGLETIKSLQRLNRLDLHGCPRIADDAIPILAAMPVLESIDLTDTKVTAAGIEKLQRAKPHCRVLLAPSTPKRETPTAER
jgi:Leucine-rich repeat (LRR) protein